MAEITIPLPEELLEIMKKYKEVDWKDIATKSLWKHAKKLELMDSLLKHSQLTEEDALEIGMMVNEAVAKRHNE